MSNSIRANQLEERELFLLANNVPYDDRANLSANIADMKSSLLSEFLYTVGSDLYEASLKRPVEELAADMKLIGGPSELRKPLNVGLMFFNERPDNFFPYARIEVVDKPDPTGVGMTEKVFIGPLDKQLKDALSYIKNYIIKEKVIKIPGQAEAERIFNIPYAAVEEALSNAQRLFTPSPAKYALISASVPPLPHTKVKSYRLVQKYSFLHKAAAL